MKPGFLTPCRPEMIGQEAVALFDGKPRFFPFPLLFIH